MYLCVWNGVRSYFLLSQTGRARLYPPPPPERNPRRKPVTAGALSESDSLSVHVFGAMQLSDS